MYVLTDIAGKHSWTGRAFRPIDQITDGCFAPSLAAIEAEREHQQKAGCFLKVLEKCQCAKCGLSATEIVARFGIDPKTLLKEHDGAYLCLNCETTESGE
jgi:hypothetical protein